MGADMSGGMSTNLHNYSEPLPLDGNLNNSMEGPGYEEFRTPQFNQDQFAYSVHDIVESDSFQGFESLEPPEVGSHNEATLNEKVESSNTKYKNLLLGAMLLPGLAAPAFAKTCSPAEAKEYRIAKVQLAQAKKGIEQNTPRKITYANAILALEQQIARAKASGRKVHADIPRNLNIKRVQAGKNIASINDNTAIKNRSSATIKHYDAQKTCPEPSDHHVDANVVRTYDGINDVRTQSRVVYDNRRGRAQQYNVDWSTVDANGISPQVKAGKTWGHRTSLTASASNKASPYNNDRPVSTISASANYTLQPTNNLIIGLNIADITYNNSGDYPYTMKSGASFVQFSTIIKGVRQTFRLAGAPHGRTVTGTSDFGKYGVIESKVVRGNDGMNYFSLRYINSY